MRMWMAFFLFISMVSSQGCFWPFRASARPAVEVPVERPMVSVEVLNEAALRVEGTIAFVPFVAGPEAEAGPVVDRLALLVVKGAADVVNASASSLKISTEQDLSSAAFVLDGRVEAFSPDAKWKWVGFWRSDIVFRISGELRHQKSGEVIAVISGQKIFRKMKNADQAAYDMGVAIGEGLIR